MNLQRKCLLYIAFSNNLLIRILVYNYKDSGYSHSLKYKLMIQEMGPGEIYTFSFRLETVVLIGPSTFLLCNGRINFILSFSSVSFRRNEFIVFSFKRSLE